MSNVLLIFGHGYTAQALSPNLISQGWSVIGTTREKNGVTAINATGAKGLIWPGMPIDNILKQAKHLLISVAPDASGDPVLNDLKHIISDMQDQFSWVGYLSTTGVYGDHQGGWVDETTPLNPATQRGRWRLEAETAWQQMNLPLHIFRLAGIYGPNRGPFSKLKSGKARRIIKKNQVFSRIHVDDIAQVLIASITNPKAGSIYNVCDDIAAAPEDVIEYAAKLTDLPVPVSEDFDNAEMTPMARSFYSESKKVSNARIKNELGITLKYPNYKIGLQALLQAELKKQRDGT